MPYWQIDQLNIQKWHMKKLLIFKKDIFHYAFQHKKSGQVLIIFHTTCRVSPPRCKSPDSHHRLFICWGLSGLLCPITSAYQCSLLPDLSRELACWITGVSSILSWYLQTPCAWYQLSQADNGVTNSFPFWWSVIQAVVQVFMSQAFLIQYIYFVILRVLRHQNEPDKCWQHKQ